ncbi:hypothetical protein [Halalkalibacter lacteus]|uniref:hypothetical protein n=1 Tax=Halalkalibacter lacteus TaxID=3090663 RepID=UPI002FCA9399
MRKHTIRFLIALLIISSISFSVPGSEAEASTAVIDSYISVNSVTKNATNQTISVKYTVKKTIPSAIGLCIGYEWPSTYRLSSSYNYCKAVNKTAGSYTMSIPKPSINIIGSQNVVVKLSGGYSEKKNVKSVFNYPTTKVVKPHTVTKADALAEYFVVGGIGVGVKFMKNNALGFVTKTAYAGYTTYYGLKGIGVISGFPPAAVGQYYIVETWYNSNGLNVKNTIWASKAAYDSKHQPIYTGTVVSRW